MTRIGVLILAVTCLLLTAQAVRAQVEPATDAEAPEEGYSLPELLRLALELRPSLRAERSNLQAADAATRRQAARWLPNVQTSWQARTSQSLSRSVSVGGGVLQSASGRTTSREASVTVDLTFWDNSITPAVRQARASERAARHRMDDTERILLEDVALLYFTVLGNQRFVDVAAAAVESAQRHLDMADARIEAGTVARSDRLSVEVELARARLQDVQARKALLQTLAGLRAAVGLPELTTVRPLGAPGVPEVEGELEGFAQEALDARSDIFAQKAAIQGRELAVRLAKINAGLSVSASGHAEYGRFTGVSGDSWWVQAGLSFPLFDGGSRADLAAAKADLASTRAQLDEVELQVTRQVEQALLGVTEGRAQIEHAAVAEASAQLNLEVAEERYQEGVAMIVEVTDADLSLRQAQADNVQALYDYNSARVALLSAMGRNLLESLGESQ